MASVIDKLRVQGNPAPLHHTMSTFCGQGRIADLQDSGARLDAPPQGAAGDVTFLTASEPDDLTQPSPRQSALRAPAIISPSANRGKAEVRHGRSGRAPVSLVFLTVPVATDFSCLSLAAGKNGLRGATRQKCAYLSDCVHGCAVRHASGGQHPSASSSRQPRWRRHFTASATSSVTMMTPFELTGSRLARFDNRSRESPQSPSCHERPSAAVPLRSALPGLSRGRLKGRQPAHLKDSSRQAKSADLHVISQCLHVLSSGHALEQSSQARRLQSPRENVDVLGGSLEGGLEARLRNGWQLGETFRDRSAMSDSRRKFVFDSVARYIHFNKLCPEGKDVAMGDVPSWAYNRASDGVLQEPRLGGVSSHYTDAILVQMLSGIRRPGRVHGIGIKFKDTKGSLLGDMAR